MDKKSQVIEFLQSKGYNVKNEKCSYDREGNTLQIEKLNGEYYILLASSYLDEDFEQIEREVKKLFNRTFFNDFLEKGKILYAENNKEVVDSKGVEIINETSLMGKIRRILSSYTSVHLGDLEFVENKSLEDNTKKIFLIKNKNQVCGYIFKIQ